MLLNEGGKELDHRVVVSRRIQHDSLQREDPAQPNVDLVRAKLFNCSGIAIGELAFASYGIQDSTVRRNDFAGVVVAGKTLVIVAGAPANADSALRAKYGSVQNAFLRLGGLVQRQPAADAMAEPVPNRVAGHGGPPSVLPRRRSTTAWHRPWGSSGEMNSLKPGHSSSTPRRRSVAATAATFSPI